MSQADTKRFFQDMADKADLKAEADKAKDFDALASLASSKGYQVSTDDLKVMAAQNKDLSDEQLEAVAGGFNVDMGVSVGCVVCVSFS